jgi:hypothetical protein
VAADWKTCVRLRVSGSRQLISTAESAAEKASQSGVEAQAALEKLRATVAEVGVVKFAEIFRAEADQRKRESWFWCVGALVCALLAIVYTLFVFEPHLQSLISSPKPPSASLIGTTFPLAHRRNLILLFGRCLVHKKLFSGSAQFNG